MNSNTFVLYNYFRSSASYRVRIALNLKQIPFEYKAVHLVNNGGEQFNPEYAKLNPSRDVPTLVHNGKPIGQSVAIIDYLDQIEKYRPLFPSDPYRRSLVLQTCEIVNSGVQPLVNLRPLAQLGSQFNANDEQKLGWTVRWLQYGCETLERHLKPHAGKFSFGDEVSAADCFVVPHVFAAKRHKIDIDLYPTLKRINETCLSMDEFSKAAPDKQPDTPPNA